MNTKNKRFARFAQLHCHRQKSVAFNYQQFAFVEVFLVKCGELPGFHKAKTPADSLTLRNFGNQLVL